MLKTFTNSIFRKYTIQFICTIALLVLSHVAASSQSIRVSTIQDLDFGYFYPVGAGGSITVSNSGTRTNSSGVVVFPAPSASEAIFQLYTNRKVYFVDVYLSVSSVTLRRIGGTGSMSLSLNAPYPDYYSSISRYKTIYVHIGGTLYVRSLSYNPAGSYTGTFDLITNYY